MRKKLLVISSLLLTQAGCNLSEIQSALNSATATAVASSEATIGDGSTSTSSSQKTVELQDCSLKTQMVLTFNSSDLTTDFSEMKVKGVEKVLESTCENIKIDDSKNIQVKKVEKKSDQISILRGPKAELYTVLADRSLAGQDLEFCHHGVKVVINFDSGVMNLDEKTISITRTINSSQDTSCVQKSDRRQHSDSDTHQIGDKRQE